MADFDTTLSSLGIKRTSTGTEIKPAGTGQTLGQDSFVALLTAQMKNQDPFNPVDNTQMVAQMAQFSSLSGITEMSSTLKSIAEKLGATSASDAMSYVGRNVLTEGSVAYPRTTGGIAGAVELDNDASNVAVTISDANGSVLKSVDLGAQAKGTVSFDWDGTTDSGEAAGNGPFKVSVTARDGTTNVTSRPLVWAPVSAVSMPSGSDPVLSVAGLGNIAVSAVRSVG